MNAIDGAAAIYVAASAINGARRGGAEEGYRLIRLAVSILAGCGLFSLFHRGAQAALDTAGRNAGIVGFAIGLGLVYGVTRKARAAAVPLMQRLVGERYSRQAGAAAGFLRAALAVSALVAFLQLSPWIPGVKKALEGSLVGRVAGEISGAKEKVAAGEAPAPGRTSEE